MVEKPGPSGPVETLEDLCARITPENRRRPLAWGPDAGAEAIDAECQIAVSRRYPSAGFPGGLRGHRRGLLENLTGSGQEYTVSLVLQRLESLAVQLVQGLDRLATAAEDFDKRN